jgi:hypothetical protein
MSLAIRMTLYFAFAALASLGVVDFDQASGQVSFNIYSLEMAAIGVVGYLATFLASRFAKVK